MKLQSIVALTALALGAVPVRALAQEHDHHGRNHHDLRHGRSGFWLSFGGGFGDANASCRCSTSGLDGTEKTGYFRIGGALNQQFLIGFESTGWKARDGSVVQDRSSSLLVGLVYPFRNQGLFVKAGVGRSGWNGGDDLDGEGWAVASGVGYDLRIFSGLSITGEAAYWHGEVGRIRNDSQTIVGDRFRQDVFEMRLGLTIH